MNSRENSKENLTDIEKYTLSVDNDKLIVCYDDNKYVCDNCIKPKTKKTKRLLYAIKGKGSLSLKISTNMSIKHIVYLIVMHPLYDDEIYIMSENGYKNEYSESQIEIKNNLNEETKPKTAPLCYIYVLELEQNKFYVGKSSKPLNRTGEHIASTLLNDASCTGAGWTKMYSPVKILEVSASYDEFDEDVYTLRYMKKNGIDNVRGGSFCELNLSRENVATLEKMIAGADDKCYYCGSSGHYINECPQKSLRRVTKKRKEKSIKLKDIPKSRIAKYYGATKLLQNSNIDMANVNEKSAKGGNTNNTNNTQNINNTNSAKNENYKCKFCGKNFDTKQKQTYHENLVCKKNKRVEMGRKVEEDFDRILEKNKHLLDKKKNKGIK
jgi:predicted GIY-YIG superfamily endonuclease